MPLTILEHPITLNLDRIDPDDDRYRLRPVQEVTPGADLVDSLARLGLLVPPLLQDVQGKGLLVVSGRRRIAAARVLGMAELSCHLLPEKVDHRTFCELFLVHALQGTSLSPAELAVFFARIASSLLPEKDLLSLLPLAGLKAQPWTLEQLRTCLELTPSALQALHTGILPLKSGLRLSGLDHRNQECAIRLIQRLRLGGSKQKKLIDYAVELTARTGRPLEEITDSLLPREEAGENRPQLAIALLAGLEKLVFPRRSRAEQEFGQFTNALDLPGGVRVDHTPDFEDERIFLHLEFAGREQFRHAWPKIRPLVENRSGRTPDRRE